MAKTLVLTAGVLAAVGVGLIAAGLYANRVPLTRPPGIVARLALYLGHNVATTGAGQRLPELRPLLLRAESADLLHELAGTCRRLGWQAVAVDGGARTVRAEVVSALFRFVDDVTISLHDVSAPDLVEARVRSASRVGRGDLGANARHVMQLRSALEARGLVVEATR